MKREFPTFREWAGAFAQELTDDELARFQQKSYHGAAYNLMEAALGCLFAVFDELARLLRLEGRA